MDRNGFLRIADGPDQFNGVTDVAVAGNGDIDDQQFQLGPFAEGEMECSCRIFSEPVEKPAVGFGNDGEGRVPPPRRMCEQPHRLSVAAIGAIENA